MPDSKAMPGFGEVDLDFEDEPSAAASAAPASTLSRVDLDLAVGADADGEVVPPSTSRVVSGGIRARVGSVHDESTRIFSGEALAASTRPPPPGVHDDGATRAWADIDALAGDDPPSSRSSSAASASGVGARDERVAAMRELYARGDAAGALALASTLGHGVVLPSHGNSADSPDASIVVEVSEVSIDLDDPFGGLVPTDEEPDLVPLSTASRTLTTPPPAAQLTLTERQSIPRRLTALADISKLKIDHRAGFLLAHVDGMQTLEEILDVCAMPAAEALGLFANLKALGVIEFE